MLTGGGKLARSLWNLSDKEITSSTNPQNPAAVQQQDPSKVKGMRGNKSGPPAKY